MSESRPPQPAAGRRWQRVALLILSLCTLLGVVVGALLPRLIGPPQYETSAQVRITRTPTPAEIAVTSHWEPPDAQTLAQMFKAGMVLSHAVEKHRLHELESFQRIQPHNVAATINDALTIRNLGGKEPDEAVVEITYASPKTADAAIVVKAIIDAYEEMLSSKAVGPDEGTVRRISKAREDLEAEIKQQRSELRKLSKSVSGEGPGDAGALEQRRLEVRKERDEAERRRVQLQTLLKTAEDARKSGASPTAIARMVRGNPLFVKPAEDAENQALLNVPVDNDKSLEALLGVVRFDLAGRERAKKDLDEKLRLADEQVLYWRNFSTEWRLLNDEIKGNEALLQALDERNKRLQPGEAETKLTAEIIVPPGPAREVSNPLLTGEVAAGAVFGLLLGVVALTFYFAFVPAKA